MENGSEDSAGKTPEELATEKQMQNRKSAEESKNAEEQSKLLGLTLKNI